MKKNDDFVHFQKFFLVLDLDFLIRPAGNFVPKKSIVGFSHNYMKHTIPMYPLLRLYISIVSFFLCVNYVNLILTKLIVSLNPTVPHSNNKPSSCSFKTINWEYPLGPFHTTRKISHVMP